MLVHGVADRLLRPDDKTPTPCVHTGHDADESCDCWMAPRPTASTGAQHVCRRSPFTLELRTIGHGLPTPGPGLGARSRHPCRLRSGSDCHTRVRCRASLPRTGTPGPTSTKWRTQQYTCRAPLGARRTLLDWGTTASDGVHDCVRGALRGTRGSVPHLCRGRATPASIVCALLAARGVRALRSSSARSRGHRSSPVLLTVTSCSAGKPRPPQPPHPRSASLANLASPPSDPVGGDIRVPTPVQPIERDARSCWVHEPRPTPAVHANVAL